MKSSKLSFIVYDLGCPPRYFEIKKSLFRFLFFVLPAVAIVSIVLFLTLGLYFKKTQKTLYITRDPPIIAQLKQENAHLAEQFSELKVERDELSSQLLNQQQAHRHREQEEQQEELTSLPSLFPLFKGADSSAKLTPPKSILAIEGVHLSSLDGNSKLQFKLVNQTPDSTRVSGHIFVLRQSIGEMDLWPKASLQLEDNDIAFYRGESFAVSRFRPVEALFPFKQREEVVFKIIVFDRQGQLLFQHELSGKAL